MAKPNENQPHNQEHKYPIVDIATCKFDEITASADMKGALVIWTKGMKVNKRVNTE